METEQQAVLVDDQNESVIDNQDTDNQVTDNTDQVESAPAKNTESDNVQKRINKLTAERYGEKRRADALQDEIDNLKKSSTQEVVQPQGLPALEEYDFDEGKHQSALIQYEVNKQMQANTEAANRNNVISKQKEIESAYDVNEVKYMTDNPEFITDIQNMPRFNNDTLSMIKAQENAPNLVHYLGKNLDTASAIALLDPISAAVQIGMISAQLSATKKTTVQTSAAPTPIEPINSGGTLSTEEGAKGVTYE